MKFSLDCYFTGSESNHIKGINYIKGYSDEINDLIKFSPKYVFHLGNILELNKALMT